MKDGDKILTKDIALIVADEIVSQIPLLNIPWKLSKALYGVGLKLRQERALAWVEMVRDNPSIFIESILIDENFQDGFVYSLENFIRERSEEKRSIIKKVFLGFAESDMKETFPIEKMFHSLNQLSLGDINVLRDILINEATAFNKSKSTTSGEEDTSLLYQIYGNTNKNRENIYNLINLGILIDETGSRLGHHFAPMVSLSGFGIEFIKYIKE